MKWKRDENELHGFTDKKRWRDMQINILMDGQVDGQTDRWADAWINEWILGKTDEQTKRRQDCEEDIKERKR